MNIKKLIVSVLVFGLAIPASLFMSGDVSADQNIYPYVKTFTISAYYSPLPCQDRYATGNYKSDIRLNGNGTNGADGTEVYPGMVAAPKSYAFGTKLFIPGIGTVAVHDRGGAIVENDGENGVYDRLDIWMGWGDVGLTRALNWGKRNVDVTVFGYDNTIVETVEFPNFSLTEAVPQECSYDEREPAVYDVYEHKTPKQDRVDEKTGVKLSNSFYSYLSKGSSGANVKQLQNELTQLNFFRGEANGVFGELTEHAVFKFQQSQGIVDSLEVVGAGVVGPQTRGRLNEIISSRNYTNVLVATKTMEAEDTILASNQ